MAYSVAQGSKKEKFRYYNTLVGVVKGLENHYTTVDLQNENCVTGKITYVDGFMNINMEDAVFYDTRGNEHLFESFFIRARIIRYVHIPNNLQAEEIIENLLPNVLSKRNTTSHTFKTSRAKKYHNEILKDIYAAQEESENDLTESN